MPDAVLDGAREARDGQAHRGRRRRLHRDRLRAVPDGDFGWYVVDPGHGLVFASTRRPQDAAAAAPLSATGTYGPLLLLTDAGVLPAPLQDYLLDIQPGYDADPVRGVYNHGWIIGDESAIAAAVQARIDTLSGDPARRHRSRSDRWPKPSSPNVCVATARSRWTTSGSSRRPPRRTSPTRSATASRS